MSPLSPSPSSAVQRRLFLLWRDPRTKRYFSVGQLVRRTEAPRYEFRYLPGYVAAHRHGLDPLLSFPDRDAVYESDQLFPFFENRLMRKSRPDFAAYVQSLDLDPATATDMEILGRSGGERATDSFRLLPEPEPVAEHPGHYQILFFATGMRRQGSGTWQHIVALTAGDRLALGDDGRLSHAGVPVGEVPAPLRALLPECVDDVVIEVVRRNRAAPRFMVLCRCRFQSTEVLHPLLTAAPDGLTPAQGPGAAPYPRLLDGQTVAPGLAMLIERLAEGNAPELPVLAQPVGGTLYGRRLADPGTALTVDPMDWALRLHGSDRATGAALVQGTEDHALQAHLDLADGSSVVDAQIGSRGMSAGWWCQLSRWWWQSSTAQVAPVRYWVGLLPDAELDWNCLNMAVSTLSQEALLGLHIEGTPTWTVLKLPSLSGGSERSALAIIIEARSQQGEPYGELYEASRCLTVATGIPAPRIFFGYDQHLQVCAAYAPGRVEESPSESGLPVRPLRQADAPNRRLSIWPVPFLHCLRETLQSKSLPGTYDAVMDALVYFCWALQEPCIPTKLALLAVVPRTLLRAASGVTLSDAEAFDPSQIATALERLAAQRRLRLPADALAALSLSHRIALYGEGGLRGAGLDVRSFWSSGQWGSSVETLRTLGATLLAGTIRYYGPVVGQVHPARAFSSAHEPWAELDAKAQGEKAKQTELASTSYVVGDFETQADW